MKAYIQFLVADTKGSPIDRLGTDGRQILDGRLSLENMFTEGLRSSGKKLFKPVGFKIIKANSFRDEGKVLKTHIFKVY